MFKRAAGKKGFSLVELVISISIFALLSVVTIINYNDFNNHIGVDILAHQIAQYGREAQVDALSVKCDAAGNCTGVATTTFPGYGVHFALASSTGFLFFADQDGDMMYDADGSCGGYTDECQKKIQLLKGSSIVALCGIPTSGGGLGSSYCTGNLKQVTWFDMAFRRPNPDAVIQGVLSTGSSTAFSETEVVISSNKGYQRKIDFWDTGQMSVK